MKGPKEMVLTLFIVASFCAVVLSIVYSFTLPQIEKTMQELTLQGLRETIAADEFKEVIPDTLWRAFDSSGNFLGIVFRVFPQGYGGPIPITVGLDPDKSITAVRIAGPAEGLKETPGLGAKITESGFIKQFSGKSSREIAIKKDGGEIDAITAATISSRAVCNGVRKGIERYSNYLSEELDYKKNLFPDANNFYEVIEDSLWYAVANNETLGIVFVGLCQGYLDDIKYIAGLARDGRISGVEILYSSETEGIGERIREEEFLNKFKEGIPEAITGATISSQALIDAIKNSIKRFQVYLK